MGFGLTGRLIGIVGLGNTGREFVTLTKPLELRYQAFDPYVRPEIAASLGVELVDLRTLMATSDIVCVMAALTPETRHLLGADELALMKPTAYLVNVARGAIIDQAALTDALAASVSGARRWTSLRRSRLTPRSGCSRCPTSLPRRTPFAGPTSSGWEWDAARCKRSLMLRRADVRAMSSTRKLPGARLQTTRKACQVTDECFLCNYNAWPVDDLPPRERVFSNDYWRVLVHQSAIPGWLVVGLRRHVARLSDLTEEETISLGPALSAGTQALIDVVGCAKTYAMLFSESVAHVHFNLVPRMADMPDKFRGAGIFGYNVVATPLDEAARDDLGRRLATAWPVH